MHRNDFQKLAQMRLEEAKVLRDNGRFDGAYYLAGYALECALKACIAKQTRADEFPPTPEIVKDFYSHSLDKLLNGAQLRREFEERAAADKRFAQSWNLVKDWSEKSRYEPHTQKDARDLIDAIEDSEYGVLAWLQGFW
jgi:HEPN domain-containing protein